MTKQHEGRTDFYSVQYTRFDSELAAELRREVFGEDIGQQGWRTAAEQAEIADLLCVGQASHVLDVCCGSGGPSLALVERTGCRLTGLDLEDAGIAHAQSQATARGLADRATFAVRDCGRALPYEGGSFDAVLCIDAVSHLRDRFGTLCEWARLLHEGGRLVFTDSAVITGPVAKSELDIRTATGFFLFVPPGVDEEAIKGSRPRFAAPRRPYRRNRRACSPLACRPSPLRCCARARGRDRRLRATAAPVRNRSRVGQEPPAVTLPLCRREAHPKLDRARPQVVLDQ